MTNRINLCASIGLSILLTIGGSIPAMAQSMATEREIAKYSTDYIPEFKSTIVNQSGNAKLGEIAVNVDFASFGDNKTELENGQRQLIHVKGALLFLNKDAVSKARIERKFKKISIILVSSESQRSLAMSNGELIILYTGIT